MRVYFPITDMPNPTVDAEHSRSRTAQAEADAPESIGEIVALLPDLSAEVVRQDVASGRRHGVRSEEQDRLVGLVRALRSKLRSAENSALRALMAGGCNASASLQWLRSDADGEPRHQKADDGMVSIPLIRDLDDLRKVGVRFPGPAPAPEQTGAGESASGDGAT